MSAHGCRRRSSLVQISQFQFLVFFESRFDDAILFPSDFGQARVGQFLSSDVPQAFLIGIVIAFLDGFEVGLPVVFFFLSELYLLSFERRDFRFSVNFRRCNGLFPCMNISVRYLGWCE